MRTLSFRGLFRGPPSANSGLHAPWKGLVPCAPGGAVSVGRHVDGRGRATIRRIHGAEALRLQ
eukprot:6573204-Alexandrium_andersonii.AAC.1